VTVPFLVRLSVACLAGLVLMGAAPTPERLERINPNAGGRAGCAAETGVTCYFVNSPVRLKASPIRLEGRKLTFYATARRLEFVDGQQRKWVAPKGTLTDGASIPALFIPLVGNPRTTEFLNAATVHDAYCGVGNEAGSRFHRDTWQNVHRMFYDTLIVGGTSQAKAQMMFAAVWLGGPRWRLGERRETGLAQTHSKADLLSAMRATQFFIEQQNPTLDDLIQFLKGREGLMVSANTQGFGEGFSGGQGLVGAATAAGAGVGGGKGTSP
jgi:hypothetical protein